MTENLSFITMKQFYDIAISSARGLAYLHTEIHKDGALHKSCIAHRDLKSKNILIKSDGTACISDFGLAIKWPIEVQNEAQGQVGTARYMAPEVLEGAISFDRETYFRIDVYAFSLILWELTSRTKTLNGPVSDYRPPFDEMVPPNPSIEDMRKVVVDQQQRPTIPKVFTNQSDIVGTIEETWDKDADARLSAQCVYERLTSFVKKFEAGKEGERESGEGRRAPHF